MPVTEKYIESLLNTTPSAVYINLICAAFVCTVFSVSVKGVREGIKTSSIIFLILYAAIVINTTVLSRPLGSERGIIYIPFWSYFAIFDGKSKLLEENIMNVIAFLPIGLFLAIGTKRLKWWQAIVAGCSLSVVIEFLQYYFNKGQCEIDDVIHNSLGCVIGYFIVKAIVLLYNSLKPRNNKDSNSLSIFDIQQSKQAKEFVLHNGNLEFDVFADILKSAKDIPYIGLLFKLGKVAVNYVEYRFVRKLHYFFEQSEILEPEKKEKFLNSLSPDDNKRINSYLTQSLYSSEEDARASLMGKIYRSRLLDEIDNDMMLRLCSVVNKAFLPDLEHLHEYTAENDSDDYIRDNLNALGLLQDLGNVYEEHHVDWHSTGFGPTKHQLNAVGHELLRIMDS